MKNAWKTINKLSGKFHSRPNEMRAMETTEGRLTDSQDIAEFMYGYYANGLKRLCDQARANLCTSVSFRSALNGSQEVRIPLGLQDTRNKKWHDS